MSEKIKCKICKAMIDDDQVLSHLTLAHGVDVIKHMEEWNKYRGLGIIFLVFAIGIIFGLIIGVLV